MRSPLSEAYALTASHREEPFCVLFATILSRSLRPAPASADPFPRGTIRIRFRSHQGDCATWLHELGNDNSSTSVVLGDPAIMLKRREAMISEDRAVIFIAGWFEAF